MCGVAKVFDGAVDVVVRRAGGVVGGMTRSNYVTSVPANLKNGWLDENMTTATAMPPIVANAHVGEIVDSADQIRPIKAFLITEIAWRAAGEQRQESKAKRAQSADRDWELVFGEMGE